MRFITRNVLIPTRWLILILFMVGCKLDYDSDLHHQAVINESVNRPVTTYDWFTRMQAMFMIIGEEQRPEYKKTTPYCTINMSELGPIRAQKNNLKILGLWKKLPFVAIGGYYAPLNCSSRHKVAILVPYRNREANLAYFLNHMHPFLKRQNMEYQIFVIEQYGNQTKFNKGALFNIGFLESQRFGEWQCFIFHDVDLLPIDDRILYTCPDRPTHMSAAVESHGFKIPYLIFFGGVTSMKLQQFETVNGYSNLYSGSNGQDDDMFYRLHSQRYRMVRYNASIARYASLPHEKPSNQETLFGLLLRKYRQARKQKDEGLKTLKYKLVHAQRKRLYTCILADLSPLE